MPGRLDLRTFPHCCGGLPEYMSTKGVHDRAGNFPLRFMFGFDHPIISYRKISVQRSLYRCLLIWYPYEAKIGRTSFLGSSLAAKESVVVFVKLPTAEMKDRDWEFVGKRRGKLLGLDPVNCCDVVIRRPDKTSSGEELPRPQQHPVLGLGTVSILMRDICNHRCQV
ncbi:hypothetical protein BO79DRAFT_230498 [Aspergillus costaricaensis CBS 115574]|uniref:Uncharacterized protein n=1 Tax=Aspergillus costaricaensis CBS 115574 TaxID=1448317 RepID=A0ACD1I8N7_9EURO|nr:hypothetical protein BO79DRAFT_230498 [Aspergillus costaricaensis CBS 115574]RAK86443.1 hypothetical protein BO79DRAFT_230498 [Aspergillus costaricaensis CBS 115574]